MKKIAVLSMVLLMFGFTASAAEFIGSEKNGGNVDLASTETHKNLHVAGGVVQINSPTTGDLLVAGGIVKVSGNVEADLFAAGGRVSIDAVVGKNIHAVGGNIWVNKPVGGDLVVGGGTIEITKAATVAGDFAAAGGSVIIDSPVIGNVKIIGGDVMINGKVTGNVEVEAQQSLTFGSGAVVTGKVMYKGPSEAVVNSGAQVPTIEYTKVTARRGHNGPGGFFALLLVSSILKFLMLLVAALVLIWFFPNKTMRIVTQALSKPWPALGIGFLVLVLPPIVGVLLCISVVGLYVGLAVLASWFLMIIVASVIQLFYTGALIWGWYKKDDVVNRWRDFGVGAVAFIILSIIPVVGWLALVALFLISLGALATSWHKEHVESR